MLGNDQHQVRFEANQYGSFAAKNPDSPDIVNVVGNAAATEVGANELIFDGDGNDDISHHQREAS